MNRQQIGRLLSRALPVWALMMVAGFSLGLSGATAREQWVGPNEYTSAALAVSSTNTAIAFGFQASVVVVQNTGANEVFVTFASSTATTSSMRIESGAVLNIALPSPAQGMGVVCTAAETSAVNIGAWK